MTMNTCIHTYIPGEFDDNHKISIIIIDTLNFRDNMFGKINDMVNQKNKHCVHVLDA